MRYNLIEFSKNEIKELMIQEINLDILESKIYLSNRLTEKGKKEYPELLKTSILENNLNYLITELDNDNRISIFETYTDKNGSIKTRKTPHNTSEILAENELNRYYIRAVCLYAINNNIENIIVYRAKFSENPNMESENKIGQKINAILLLNDLRKNIGIDTFLGVPSNVNSGLSVKLD